MLEVPNSPFVDQSGVETPSNPKIGAEMPKPKKQSPSNQGLAHNCAIALMMLAAGETSSAKTAAVLQKIGRKSLFRLQFILAFGSPELIASVLLGYRSLANAHNWLKAQPDTESIKAIRLANVKIPDEVAVLEVEARKLDMEAEQLDQQSEAGIPTTEGIVDVLRATESLRIRGKASFRRKEYQRRSSGLLLLAMEALDAHAHLLLSDTDPQDEER